MAQGVEGDFLRQLFDEVGALGTRADQAHVTAQHVEQLRQFINAQAADDVPDTGDTLVVGAGPTRCAIFLGIGAHAAELGDTKAAAVLAHAVLPVEHRAAAFELDAGGGQQHDRHRHQQQQGGTDNVEDPLDGSAQIALVEPVAENQPACAEVVDAYLTQRLLEVGVQVVDVHA